MQKVGIDTLAKIKTTKELLTGKGLQTQQALSQSSVLALQGFVRIASIASPESSYYASLLQKDLHQGTF